MAVYILRRVDRHSDEQGGAIPSQLRLKKGHLTMRRDKSWGGQQAWLGLPGIG